MGSVWKSWELLKEGECVGRGVWGEGDGAGRGEALCSRKDLGLEAIDASALSFQSVRELSY